MAYTHFCCRSGGDNRNAGTLDGTAVEPSTTPFHEYISGDWVAATRVFTLAGANFPADGVQVGMFASVYTNGATFTGFVGRISAVTTTTITIHATAFGGVAPTDGTANRSIRIGGSWLGPDGPATEGVPFTLTALRNAQNASTFPVRINMKTDRIYTINSPGIAVGIGAQYQSQIYAWGYQATFGDSGVATIEGQPTVGGYALMNSNALHGVQLQFTKNGNTGTNIIAGGFLFMRRCRAFSCRGGLAANQLFECLSENVAGAGFSQNGYMAFNCAAYNCGLMGFNSPLNSSVFFNCIAANCAGSGFSIGTNALQYSIVKNCDAFNNGGNGFSISNQFGFFVAQNCNAVRNTGNGLNVQAVSGSSSNQISHFGFGSGSEANVAGNWSIPADSPMIDTGSFTIYPSGVTPWIDPTNRDFGLNLDVAKISGSGQFFESATYGQPGIGSSQRVSGIGSSPSISAWVF